MLTSKVQIAHRTPSPAAGVLEIHGEVSSFAEPALMDAYNTVTSAGVKTVILNFTDLSYMNSSGIGLLVTLLIRAQRQNQRLIACGLDDHYKQIFELTRLHEAITIFPDEASALASVEG